MRYFTSGAALMLALCTTSCASFYSLDSNGMSSNELSVDRKQAFHAPPMEPNRLVSEQDCRRAFNSGGGNLRCM